ncbi:hypothetical protein Tco_1134200 [Tanacetum coccineum]
MLCTTTFRKISSEVVPDEASKSFSVFGTMLGLVNFRGQYLFVRSLFNSVQVIRLACSTPIGWAYAFHQDKSSSFRVPVANVTLFSSPHLLRENTDLVRSNQRIRPTAPYVCEKRSSCCEILRWRRVHTDEIERREKMERGDAESRRAGEEKGRAGDEGRCDWEWGGEREGARDGVQARERRDDCG